MKSCNPLQLKRSGTKQTNVNVLDLLSLCPEINIVLSYARALGARLDLDIVVTSLISDRKYAHAVTSTHADGRAFDIRIRDWNEDQVRLFANVINKLLKHLAPPNKLVAVIEKDHIHFQVSRTEWSFNFGDAINEST